MLEEINVRNFAIIEEQTVPFSQGFNVMSGETGAGKSILIDALGLQLGDRADSSWIRHGKSRCDIQSSFAYRNDGSIANWLKDNEFDDDGDNFCQLRRTLSENGKSKCYINGFPTTASNTKTLGTMLVDIHGQHAHQSLLHSDKQLILLDSFAQHKSLASSVKTAYQHWRQLTNQHKQIQDDDSTLYDKRDLLQYQLEELISLGLIENEFEELSQEQKQLTSINEKLAHINSITQILDGDDSISNALSQIVSTATHIADIDDNAREIGELFNQALIYIDEGRSTLGQYAQSVELDPIRLTEVETRMSNLHDMARKHRISPDELLQLQSNIESQLSNLEGSIKALNEIDANLVTAEKDYIKKAQKLSNSRKKYAKKLSDAVNSHLSLLNLENASFSIDFKSTNTNKASGIDEIIFLFSPNPGQGEKPLHKIASGGELSRISLAIQVAGIAQKNNTTLIFDEVDSGIGGATAEVVGRLLKQLSQYNQVICVTHLAQVASFADQHIKISKSVTNNETFTQFQTLNEKERITELARMSGGINLDKKTLEHAQELRDNALAFQQPSMT